MSTPINIWFDYYNKTMSSEYWSAVVDGPGNNVNYSVSTDLTRNIFTVGASGAGTSNIYDVQKSIPPYSGYVIKYDPYSSIQWYNYISNSVSTISNAVTCNSVIVHNTFDNNILVAGGTSSNAIVYNSNKTPWGLIPRSSGFLIKYDNVTGDPLWRVFVSNNNPTTLFTGTAINGVDESILDASIYVVGTTGSSTSTTAWSNIYDSLGSFTTPTVAVGIRQTTLSNPNSSTFLVKFDYNGIYQWRAFIDASAPTPSAPDTGTSCKVDYNGDVYVTGFIGNNTANTLPSYANIFTSQDTPTLSGRIPINSGYIVKYSSDGYVKWYSHVNQAPATTTDWATDFVYGSAVDSLNNIYYVGGTAQNTTNVAFIFNSNIYSNIISYSIPIGSAFVTKYNSSGLNLWRSYIDSSGQTDFIRSVCVDSEDNLIVGGFNGTSSSATIYDSSGFTYSNQIPANSGFIIKYNKNGNILHRSYISNAYIHGVTVDSQNNIIYAGNASTITSQIYNSDLDLSCISNFGVGNGNGFVAKTNKNGIMDVVDVYQSRVSNGWVVSWSNATPVTINGVITDSNASIYAVGNVSGTTSSLLINSDRSFSGYTIPPTSACFAKYFSNGSTEWRTYMYSIGSFPTFNSINTNLYVTGYTGSTDTELFDNEGSVVKVFPKNTGFILKYLSNGYLSKTAYISNSIVTSSFYNSLDTNVYLSGINSTASTSNIIDNTNIVVGGAIGPNTTFLIKFDSDLNIDTNWNSNCYIFLKNGGTAVTSPIINSVSGFGSNIYIGGFSGSGPTFYQDVLFTSNLLPASNLNAAFIAKFDPSGNFIWKSYVDSLVASVDYGSAVLAENSNVYFCGSIGAQQSNIYDSSNIFYQNQVGFAASSGFLAKYDNNGNLLWNSNVSSATCNCLALDDQLNVYVGGTGTAATSAPSNSSKAFGASSGLVMPAQSAYVAKYDSYSGSVIWRNYVQGTTGSNVTRGIAVDPYRYVISCGITGATQNKTVFSSNGYANPLTVPLSSAFIVKYKPNGSIVL